MSGGTVEPAYLKKEQSGLRDFGSIIRPIPYLPPEPDLFGATSALLRYFIRPNDDFVLNSLEIVDEDVFLYRLLRREKYERIAFIDVEDRRCKVFVYDSESASFFMAGPPSERKGKGGTLSYPHGRYAAASFPAPGPFIEYFCVRIRDALMDSRFKTAVVAPLRLFKKSGYCRSDVVDTVEMVGKSRHGKNILLFTLPQRVDIQQCFEKPCSGLHTSWTAAIAAAGKKRDELVAEAVNELSNRGMAVLADRYEADEIANLLLYKKFIELEPFLQSIGTSRIYPLAVRLKEHCLMEKNWFPDSGFRFIDRRDRCIQDIRASLESPALQEALVRMSAEVEPVKVGYSNVLPPLRLRRVQPDGKAASGHTGMAAENKGPGPMEASLSTKAEQKRAPATVYKKELTKKKMKELPEPYEYHKEASFPNGKWLEESVDPAILCVEAGEERGTGFFIHPEGYILTCDHVIRHARKSSGKISVKVTQVREKSESAASDAWMWIECEVKFAHELSDIALLKLRGGGKRWPYLPLAPETYWASRMEDFILPGYPLSGKINDGVQVFTGRISSQSEDVDDLGYSRRYIEGAAKSGNSGSPVISLETGRVIGLLQGSLDDENGCGKIEEMNFMRPIKYFWREIL